MGLDLTIKSCCNDPRFHLYTSEPIEVSFGNDGWPIANYIQDGLGYVFKDHFGTIHLVHSEFCQLVSHLYETEFYDYEGENEFVGWDRWFNLGIITGCCRDCGVDVFASW